LCEGICVAVLLLGGCRTGEAPGNPASTKAATGGLKIAGIGFQDDQFFKLVETGMKSEAQKLGVSLSPGSSANSIETEGSLVDTYIARQVNAIVIAPLSAKASVPALQRAHDAGIKVVTFDSPLDADFPESSIKSDPSALGSATGEAARQYIQTKLNGKAKLAIITYVALAPEPASQRTKGFEDEVKKLPGVDIVATQDAWLADKAVNVAEAVLTAHPEVNVIWAANEGGTVGAVTAVKNAGKAGKVVVFGTDISEQMADFLLNNDNILQAVTGQKPFDIGSMAVEAAVKALKGEKVEKKVSLHGVLFTRERPDEVRKYKEYLHGLIK
jgi:ABC-type sugar transport system substrate-binding protein